MTFPTFSMIALWTGRDGSSHIVTIFYGISFSFLFRVSVLLLPLISLSYCRSGATRYLKWPDVMFYIAAGYAVLTNATSQKPVRLSCSGNWFLKTTNVFSANATIYALDTKLKVKALSEIVFDGLSIRKTWRKLFFKEGQFGFTEFALN